VASPCAAKSRLASKQAPGTWGWPRGRRWRTPAPRRRWPGRPGGGDRLDAGEAQALAKLERGPAEFRSYVEANAGFIPNYGERHRQGEVIATGFVESTVNAVVSKRFAKRQQMQWPPKGAHLLLQVRTRVLNEELGDVFR
jgi:hypothetical protein